MEGPEVEMRLLFEFVLVGSGVGIAMTVVWQWVAADSFPSSCGIWVQEMMSSVVVESGVVVGVTGKTLVPEIRSM